MTRNGHITAIKGYNIFTQFAIGIAIIGVIATIMFVIHGATGMMVYLLFACLCLTPATVKTRKILRYHD